MPPSSIGERGSAMTTGTRRIVRTMSPMHGHPTLCGMLVEVEDGRLVEVRGDRDNPDSQGFLCIRGQASRAHLLRRFANFWGRQWWNPR
jgi:anaerobic selenocysteine-containing dehydrogenase